MKKFFLFALFCILFLFPLTVHSESSYQLISHRGYCGDAPENTMAAFQSAARLGFRYIETDVRESSDKAYFLMHDSTLDRTTNASGAISGYSAEELGKIRVDSGNGNPAEKEYHIPALAEFLQFCRYANIVPILHIKKVSSYKKLFTECNQYYPFDKIIFECTAEQLYKMKTSALQLGFSSISLMGVNNSDESVQNTINRHSLCDLTWCAVSKYQLNSSAASFLSQSGIIYGAYTVDSYHDLDRMVYYGASFIITNSLLPSETESRRHDPGSETVLLEPTCTAPGLKSVKCRICEIELYKENIPALPHRTITEIIKASPTENGKRIVKCADCGYVVSTETILRPKKYTFTAEAYIYNGKEKKPKIIVTDKTGAVIPALHYTLGYKGKRVNIGIYTINVKFNSEFYKGTKQIQFAIRPRKPKARSLTKLVRGFELRWKKATTPITGYQIEFATNKAFKNSKYKRIPDKEADRCQIYGLRSKQKYYVRLRTYKQVKGKNLYSRWTDTVAVKTK